MKKLLKNETLLLIYFIAIFMAIRSVWYVYHLNFSGDQAAQSTKVLELYRARKFTLLGNEVASLKYQGRAIFQGPATYYILFIFLFFGGFDPIASSYLFTIFCALMIIPLYYGVKLLLNQRSALVMTVIYTFTPFYINYTRFLWNPNFQFSLIPVLIYLMGIFKKNRNTKTFLFFSILLGILLQLHYQFLLIIVGFFLYYFIIKRLNFRYFLTYISGLIIGFSPLILFELRNKFYNIKTAIFILKNYGQANRVDSKLTPHYYLATSFLIILIIIALINIIILRLKKLPQCKAYFKKQKAIYKLFLVSLIIILFVGAALKNFKKPVEAFWAPVEKWNYLYDHKIYEIVKKNNLDNFNIANLAYDTLSVVPKYLLKKDKININYDDYWHNQYLFVINKDDKYFDNPAYEVKYFHPSKLLNKWKLNKRYTMFLLERTIQ